MSRFSDVVVDLQVTYEVERTLNEVVADVEVWWSTLHVKKLETKVKKLTLLSKHLLARIDSIEKDREALTSGRVALKERAELVREKFAVDITQALRDSRQLQSLHQQLQVSSSELAKTKNELKRNVAIVNDLKKKAEAPVVSAPQHKHLLADLEQDHILRIITFLNAEEVLSTAQVNKFIFKRIDSIFCLESSLVRPEWSERPVCFGGAPSVSASTSASTSSSTSSSRASSSALDAREHPQLVRNETAGGIAATTPAPSPPSGGLTRELVDALSRKLTPVELRAIITLTELLKKESLQLQNVSVERDDLQERLKNAESMRDSLIDKLKTAEVAIKSFMTEGSGLRRQASADQEVISFLDLRSQELEGVNLELTKRCERLQAAYDLQASTNSHSERRLLAELSQFKAKWLELESAFKSQKKILVKEVKSLRSQLEIVTNERNTFRGQLNLLREAFMGSNIELKQSRY